MTVRRRTMGRVWQSEVGRWSRARVMMIRERERESESDEERGRERTNVRGGADREEEDDGHGVEFLVHHPHQIRKHLRGEVLVH